MFTKLACSVTKVPAYRTSTDCSYDFPPQCMTYGTCSLLSSVHTNRVCSRAVSTARERGCPKWRPCSPVMDTSRGHDTRVRGRVHGPWTRTSFNFCTSVFTGRGHGPRTHTGSVYWGLLIRAVGHARLKLSENWQMHYIPLFVCNTAAVEKEKK